VLGSFADGARTSRCSWARADLPEAAVATDTASYRYIEDGAGHGGGKIIMVGSSIRRPPPHEAIDHRRI
jgi:hypothetical protein